MELVKHIYKTTGELPPSEQFALANQMRRAAVAIPSNIAEGKKRSTRKDFVHFLHIADGSAAELETQLLIVKDLYPKVNCIEAENLLEEIQKMLTVMIGNLKAIS